MSKIIYLLSYILFFVSCSMTESSVWKKAPSPSPLQWPVYRSYYPAIPYLSSTFGESRSDHFHNGLDLAGIDEDVFPLADGKAVYVYKREDDPYAPVRGPGNTVIIDHGGGWWSGYYHLTSVDDDKGILSGASISVQDRLGEIGNTGRSSGSHLHFLLISNYGKTMVNPLHHLPKIEDPNPPRLGSLFIVSPQGRTRIPAKRKVKIRLTRSYPLLIEAEDPGRERGSRRGLYKLEWNLNGGTKQLLRFDQLHYYRKHWHLASHRFEKVFLGRYYHLGADELEFRQGLNTVQVEAWDYAGNHSQTSFQIQVDRQY